MLSGARGDIAIQTGTDGVLAVDTGIVQNVDQILQQIRKLSQAFAVYHHQPVYAK